MLFLHFHTGSKFFDFLFASLDNTALPKIGSTIKGKNLLLREQILSFKR